MVQWLGFTSFPRHHDHGPAFWKLVDDWMPTWRTTKRTLDDVAELLLMD
ncbi:MAG: M48 family metallopeptidase [Maritimibacter sp.]|nr:M48 family metallopeptidase [Sedimentitalea sp.]MCB1357981.1 M48 family metallopeptidase [Maritimibacter sp.]